MSDKLPGNGLFGWFGRQVGHVKKAVKTKPTAKSPAKSPAKRSAPQSGGAAKAPPRAADSPGPGPSPSPAPAGPPAVLYRQGQVHEAEHPTQPGVKLRRTIIDEVIVDDANDPTGKAK